MLRSTTRMAHQSVSKVAVRIKTIYNATKLEQLFASNTSSYMYFRDIDNPTIVDVYIYKSRHVILQVLRKCF